MPFAKQFSDLPFGMLAYTKSGQGGLPVVFLHGIPTSSFLWRDVVALLPDHTCYALDLLGYGDSDKPASGDLSIVAQARYVEAWASLLGISSFVLVGHDIGGGVALQLAVHHPRRVAGLGLVDSICYDSWPEPNVARLKESHWDQTLRARDLRPGFRRALETGLVHKDRLNDAVVEGYVGPFLGQAGRQAYLRCARALDTSHTTTIMNDVEALDVPTLVLWGQQDPFQKLEYGQRLARSMKRASLEVCEDGSHFLPEDRPEWVAGRLNRFLSGIHA
jgi:pimeloyl-ACP methyl ester carboxylesterase